MTKDYTNLATLSINVFFSSALYQVLLLELNNEREVISLLSRSERWIQDLNVLASNEGSLGFSQPQISMNEMLTITKYK